MQFFKSYSTNDFNEEALTFTEKYATNSKALRLTIWQCAYYVL